MTSDDSFTFVCNECGDSVDKSSRPAVLKYVDEHHEHDGHRNYYITDPEGEVIYGEKEREPRGRLF